jgi:hypothetical protein
VQVQTSSVAGLAEEAAYFAVPGAHLYTVVHRAANPVARVLLVGAFASERHFAYYSWVRWARYLASRDVEVLRYDYRGIGESTGVFEELNFEDWREDVRLLAEWFARESPKVPFMLHGLELGAILAGKSFHEGIGDGLLLWSPPANANQVLRSTLLRWAGLEQVFEAPENRKTVAEYIRQLEQGTSVNVLGYQWPSDLWRNSNQFEMPAGVTDQSLFRDACERPVKAVRFGKETGPLALPYPRYPEMRDLSELYSSNFKWLAETLALPAEMIQ